MAFAMKRSSGASSAGGGGGAAAGAANALARAALVAFAYACMGFYVFYVVLQLLPKWYWGYEEGNPWDKFRHDTELHYNLPDPEDPGHILDGWNTNSIIMGAVPIWVAALATYVLLRYARGDPQKPRRDSAVKLWIKRVMGHQIAPQRFWLWWCDGMSVFEMLLVLAWLGAHAMGIVLFVQYYDNYVNEQTDALDAAGIAYSDAKWLWRFNDIALALSWVFYFDLGFLFFPIAHSSFVHYLTGLNYQQLLRYHRWMGHSFMLFLSCHGVGYWLYWAINPRVDFWDELLNWNRNGYVINLLAGTISYLFAVALWVTSIEWVRRNFFQVFYTTHIIGFLGFFLFGFMHYNWIWPTAYPALALWAADIVYRMMQAAKPAMVTAAEVNSDGRVTTLQLAFDQSIAVLPLQDIFVCIPAISRWQYHPLSVGAVRMGDDGTQLVHVHAKVYSRWTKKLAALAQRSGAGAIAQARVLGPYGSFAKLEDSYFRSSSWRSYSSIVLLGGGIGAVPLLSLLREMIGAPGDGGSIAPGAKGGKPKQRVFLVWVVRTLGELEVMDAELLLALQENADWLTVEVRYTGGKDDAFWSTWPGASSSKGVGAQAGGAPVEGGVPQKSAFGFATRPLSLAAGHPLLSAALVTFAFAGGFFGLVLGHAWFEDQWWNGTYFALYWAGGMVLCFTWFMGMFGLPVIFVVLPAQLWSMWSARRARGSRQQSHVAADAAAGAVRELPDGLATPVGSDSGSGDGVVGGGASGSSASNPAAKSTSLDSPDYKRSSNDQLNIAASQLHTVAVRKGMDGLQLQVIGVALESAAASIPVLPGRPDVRALLEAAQSSCEGSRMGVFAAGPRPMLQAAELEVNSLNGGALRGACCGKRGGAAPYIDFHKEAWEF